MRSYRVLAYGEPLEAVDRPTPQAQGTEVLLRVRAAGVCHSDVHMWQGGFDLGTGKLSLKLPVPFTMGHETAGEVVAVGPDARGVAIGDLRLVFPWIGCGACIVCGAGDEHLCTQPQILGVQREGGYADYILVPHSRVLLDARGLDPAHVAPYACSGLTAYSALKKISPAITQGPILIIGAGGLGLMALTLLQAMGGAGAIAADIDERKREAAHEAGARAVIDANAADAGARITQAAGGPVRAAIDFVGSTASTKIAMNALANGGKLVLVGLFGGAAGWPLPLIALRAITVQGNYVGSLAELRELIDLVRTHAIEPIPLTLRPLSDVTAALEDLQTGRVVGRCVLVTD